MRLVLKGRLVTWIPVRSGARLDPPTHPALTLLACSEQPLSVHTARRLLTWEKTQEMPDADATIPDLFPEDFRQQHFHREETRKQRRERERIEREAKLVSMGILER